MKTFFSRARSSRSRGFQWSGPTSNGLCHVSDGGSLSMTIVQAGSYFAGSNVNATGINTVNTDCSVAGAIVAAGVLLVIASGNGSNVLAGGLAANGYGEHSPGHYDLAAAFLTEAVMTAMFLFVIMGATDKRAPAGFAPLAIGLTLTLIHLISIPVTNTSVNPARSTGPAVFVHGWAVDQLWLFWVAPLLGAATGAALYRLVAMVPRAGVEPA